MRQVVFVLTLAALLMAGVAVMAQDEVTGTEYVVREGETLVSVAQRFEKPILCILEANGIAVRPLEVGETLFIPDDCDAITGQVTSISASPAIEITAEVGAESTAEPQVEATAVPAPATTGQGGGAATVVTPLLADTTHTVVRGDRLARIAEAYGVPLACLVRVNGIVNPDLIYVGQQLIIPANCQNAGGGAVISSPVLEGDVSVNPGGIVRCQFDRNAGRVATNGSYIIQAGDTMDFIACDFNIALSCLEETNPQVALRGKIFVGDELTIDRACPGWGGPILAEQRENG